MLTFVCLEPFSKYYKYISSIDTRLFLGCSLSAVVLKTMSPWPTRWSRPKFWWFLKLTGKIRLCAEVLKLSGRLRAYRRLPWGGGGSISTPAIMLALEEARVLCDLPGAAVGLQGAHGLLHIPTRTSEMLLITIITKTQNWVVIVTRPILEVGGSPQRGSRASPHTPAKDRRDCESHRMLASSSARGIIGVLAPLLIRSKEKIAFYHSSISLSKCSLMDHQRGWQTGSPQPQSALKLHLHLWAVCSLSSLVICLEHSLGRHFLMDHQRRQRADRP